MFAWTSFLLVDFAGKHLLYDATTSAIDRNYSFLVPTNEKLIDKATDSAAGIYVASMFAYAFIFIYVPIKDLLLKTKEVKYYGMAVDELLEKNSDEERALSLQVLNNEILISEKTMNAIKEFITLKRADFLNNQELVYSIDSEPDLVFSISSWVNDALERQTSKYDAMVKGQSILRNHKLDLLVIPRAKLVEVKNGDKKYFVIAKKKINYNDREYVQGEYFERHADRLDETIAQLAIFICKTKYSSGRLNHPILDEFLHQTEKLEFGLVNFTAEHHFAHWSLFGSGIPGTTSLVDCVTLEQAMIIKKIALENGVSTQDFEEAYTKREKEITENEKLQNFYQCKGIVIGNEYDIILVNSLLDQEETRTTKFDGEVGDGMVRDLTKRVIESVIQNLQKTKIDPIKYHRQVILDIRKKTSGIQLQLCIKQVEGLWFHL